MRLTRGSIRLSGSIEYVPQIPWILSRALRDNILFGRDYSPLSRLLLCAVRILRRITSMCTKADMSQMVGGDMAFTGDKGVNLSGGQRVRLAWPGPYIMAPR
ncbi:multidrug resistance-associated protein 11 [Actinidia rufa]|uniref:Multidrug resistance-associated protein 11 n=1 Tax=Actinidia rufa TaxID=165716 RepID=A0A7J0H9G0_9ERIC|nr:multidrug resistance-associated protein 11 [Actinidia rufa]